MNFALFLLFLLMGLLTPLAPPEPKPHNVLTISVFSTYTEIHDNGQLITTFDDSCKDTRIWNNNAHTCNGDITQLEDLIDGYLPLPYDYLTAIDKLRKETRGEQPTPA